MCIFKKENTGSSLVAEWVKDPGCHCCGLCWIPEPGAATCLRHNQKKKKKKKKKEKERKENTLNQKRK